MGLASLFTQTRQLFAGPLGRKLSQIRQTGRGPLVRGLSVLITAFSLRPRT